MASNDPSRRASAASSDTSLVDPSAVAKLLPKKDSMVGKVKIKKPVPKVKTDSNDVAPRSPSLDSPLVNEIDPELRATFPTGRPMEDKAELVQCKHCKKPMLKSVAATHITLCLQKKQDRAQRKKEQKEAARKAREAREKGKDEDGDEKIEDTVRVSGKLDGAEDESVNGDKATKTGKKNTIVGTSDKSKKRKADTEGDKEPKKKKTKKEIEAAKPKIPKPKGPVDVEKQCGVLLANGAFCARSLTCKSHAMGAKRAVPGRSLPYDMLLAAYQKKNQAKQQKAAIDANAPLPDDIDPAGPVDSDEEKDAVMAAIARSRPRPLEQHIFVPVRKRYSYIRMKEMLSNALGGRSGGVYGGMVMGMNAIGGMNGSGGEGAEGEVRRTSLAQQSGSVGGGSGRASGGVGASTSVGSMGGPARKASTTSLSAAVAT